jgi:RNA polymerase subunit RPABC4/transcription elongation factor Spt4
MAKPQPKLTREEIETRAPDDCFVVFIVPQKFCNERRTKKAIAQIAGIIGITDADKEAIAEAIKHAESLVINEHGKAVFDAYDTQDTQPSSKPAS